MGRWLDWFAVGIRYVGYDHAVTHGDLHLQYHQYTKELDMWLQRQGERVTLPLDEHGLPYGEVHMSLALRLVDTVRPLVKVTPLPHGLCLLGAKGIPLYALMKHHFVLATQVELLLQLHRPLLWYMEGGEPYFALPDGAVDAYGVPYARTGFAADQEVLAHGRDHFVSVLYGAFRCRAGFRYAIPTLKPNGYADDDVHALNLEEGLVAWSGAGGDNMNGSDCNGASTPLDWYTVFRYYFQPRGGKGIARRARLMSDLSLTPMFQTLISHLRTSLRILSLSELTVHAGREWVVSEGLAIHLATTNPLGEALDALFFVKDAEGHVTLVEDGREWLTNELCLLVVRDDDEQGEYMYGEREMVGGIVI